MNLKKSLVCYLSIFAFSCVGVKEEAKSDLRFFEMSEDNYSELINDKPMPEVVNLKADKTLLNRDYPIEVALYKDKKWYYDLPRFGEGSGTWEVVDGKIHLFAKTRIFDMHIDVVSLDEVGEKLALKFRDRFGPQVLSTEKLNLP